jgi:hypothetical protein
MSIGFSGILFIYLFIFLSVGYDIYIVGIFKLFSGWFPIIVETYFSYQPNNKKTFSILFSKSQPNNRKLIILFENIFFFMRNYLT